MRYTSGQVNEVRELREKRTCDSDQVRELVEKAACGDVEAFGELYGLHLDQIYRYVFHLVRNQAVAEDLTEEVFLKAWKGLGNYKWKGYAFSAWLYRVAHNHVVDYFRKNRRCETISDDLCVAAESEPSKQAEENQLIRSLNEAIASLPEQQKQLIVLKFIEGLGNDEIGQIMNKSEGAVRIMQMRALTSLRKIVAGELA